MGVEASLHDIITRRLELDAPDEAWVYLVLAALEGGTAFEAALEADARIGPLKTAASPTPGRPCRGPAIIIPTNSRPPSRRSRTGWSRCVN